MMLYKRTPLEKRGWKSNKAKTRFWVTGYKKYSIDQDGLFWWLATFGHFDSLKEAKAAAEAHDLKLWAEGGVEVDVKRYLTHLPDCQIMQDISEWKDAVLDIPDGNTQNEELLKTEKFKEQCTCGLKSLEE